MTYTLEQVNPMSWNEFENLYGKLINKIVESGVKFDAVAPILRNGMVPATVIANKLEIINVIPIQLKYFYNPTEIRLLSPIVKPSDFVSTPKILVIDSNTSSGKSAEKAYELLKTEFPDSDLYYATVTRVFKKPLNELPMYKGYLFGVMTDEDLIATQEEKTNFQLRDKITIFPWETAEKELEDINAL